MAQTAPLGLSWGPRMCPLDPCLHTVLQIPAPIVTRGFPQRPQPQYLGPHRLSRVQVPRSLDRTILVRTQNLPSPRCLGGVSPGCAASTLLQETRKVSLLRSAVGCPLTHRGSSLLMTPSPENWEPLPPSFRQGCQGQPNENRRHLVRCESQD